MYKNQNEEANNGNQIEFYLKRYGWNPNKWKVDDFQKFLDDVGLSDMKCFFSLTPYLFPTIKI